MGEFVTVGPVDAVEDNGMVAFSLGPKRIGVARRGDTFYAFDDLCTHAACSLSDGELEGATVFCPCHMGQFDLATGEVLDGPPPKAIRVYPVTAVNGELQVQI